MLSLLQSHFTPNDFLSDMQTTSRNSASAAAAHSTPSCFANWLSPLWTSPREEKKIISNIKLVFAQATREANFDSLNRGESRIGPHRVPKKPKHFLFGHELPENMEWNYWMVEWLLRAIIAVIWWNNSVVSSYDSHVVGAQYLEGKEVVYKKITAKLQHEETGYKVSLFNIPMIEQISSWREWMLNTSGSPHLPFSMEKTDLYFIKLHTWKKFNPYA